MFLENASRNLQFRRVNNIISTLCATLHNQMCFFRYIFRGNDISRKLCCLRLIWSFFWSVLEVMSTTVVFKYVQANHARGFCVPNSNFFYPWLFIFNMRGIILSPLLLVIYKYWTLPNTLILRALIPWIQLSVFIWFMVGQGLFVYIFPSICHGKDPFVFIYLLFVSVLYYLYILGYLIFIVSTRINRRHHNNGPRANDGLSVNLLKEIPLRQYTDESLNELCEISDDEEAQGIRADSSQNCAICMDTFTEGEIIRDLKCGHSFHRGCIDEWLMRKSTCPLCREKPLNF